MAVSLEIDECRTFLCFEEAAVNKHPVGRRYSDSIIEYSDETPCCETSVEVQDAPVPEWKPTTLMMRNLPNNYNRSMFLKMLNSHGFEGCYDLVYLPRDFTKKMGLGYGFVNFVEHDDARRALEYFQGFSQWSIPSKKVCQVAWNSPAQGFAENVERLRNIPAMHASAPDEFKPMLFVNGVRAPFPAPTKVIRPWF